MHSVISRRQARRLAHRLYRNEVQHTHTHIQHNTYRLYRQLGITDFSFRMTDNDVKIIFRAKGTVQLKWNVTFDDKLHPMGYDEPYPGLVDVLVFREKP